MTKTIPFLFLLMLPALMAAQSPQRLSFEFGYNIHDYSMEGLNRYFVDSFAVKSGQLEEGIRRGEQFMAALRYQPAGSFDVGIYGMYQFAQSEGRPTLTYVNEDASGLEELEWRYRLETQAVTVGLSASLFISHLLNFHEKESVLLNRLHIATEFSGGYSLAFAHTRHNSCPYHVLHRIGSMARHKPL
jgi:hypothetical protein